MSLELTDPAWMNLWQKLVEVRKVVTYLQKEKSSTQFKYVSNSQVLLAVRQKMDELGLLLVPSVTGHNVRESVIETPHDKLPNIVAKRTTTYFTEVDLSYTWINADNPAETVTAAWYAQGVDIAGEKGVGKAATYGEKYFLLKFFNIPTDLDDPDHYNNQPEAPHVPPTAPTQTSPIVQRPAWKPPAEAPVAPTVTPEAPPATSSPQPLISESQAKMLNAKAMAAGYKREHKDDLMEALSILVGRPIVTMNEIRKNEVDPVIKWLVDQSVTLTI